MMTPFNGDLERYRALGIDYIAVKRADSIASQDPVYSNSGYVVYRTAPVNEK
jgi:hypothetical protein